VSSIAVTSALRNLASSSPESPLVDALGLIEQGEMLYDVGGLPRGALPGWPTLNELYTVAPGQWTVITGAPGSGKSEFVDAMMVNLAEAGDWEFCVYSPENYPVATHLVKLCEKRARLPFGDGPVQRMTRATYRRAANWVAEHFFWIEPALKTPDELISAGLRYRQRGKNFGVLLDPWNALEHQRGTMNETDYVSFILTETTKLARSTGAHVWLVVHPAKIQRNKDGTRPVPTPYDISGSAHWYNKADNIITVHRNQAESGQDVEIHVQKVRFKHIGHVGLATLKYDKVTGRYFEPIGPGITGELYIDPERWHTPTEDPELPFSDSDPEADAERAAIMGELGD
jgi:twinkle protein